MRIIKRYENRCLYDTETSSNISLQDLKQYVLDNIVFKVVNAKTDENLTRQYLIQIILEQETMDNPFFTEDSLKQIIQFYGNPMQQWFKQNFEQALNVMTGDWQKNQKPII